MFRRMEEGLKKKKVATKMCMAAAAAAHYCTKGKRYKLQKGIHSLEKAFHNYSHPCLSFLSNSCKKSPLLFEEKKS